MTESPSNHIVLERYSEREKMDAIRSIQPPHHWPHVLFDANSDVGTIHQPTIEFHSLINLVNIIGLTAQYWELDHTSTTSSKRVLNDDIPKIQNWIKAHNELDPEVILKLCVNLLKTFKSFNTEIRGIEEATEDSPLACLNDLEEMLTLQIQDIELLINHQDPWREILFNTITVRLEKFFQTMQRNARGKYKIRFSTNPTTPESIKEKTYQVLLTLDEKAGDPNRALYVPTHLLSTIQDLMANSRKYAPVGSSIYADISQKDHHFIFTISDTGYGIASDELEKVIKYGHRSKRNKGVASHGAGCGLTKAVRLCQSYNGTLEIASTLNKGTYIQMRIPMDESLNPVAS